jgi:hypothetical protein
LQGKSSDREKFRQGKILADKFKVLEGENSGRADFWHAWKKFWQGFASIEMSKRLISAKSYLCVTMQIINYS